MIGFRCRRDHDTKFRVFFTCSCGRRTFERSRGRPEVALARFTRAQVCRLRGGGRGLRIARDQKELEKTLTQASQEAMAAFKDDTLYLEKYIEGPRHVEVQILADSHGTVVHLFERDCTVQRRYQKLIEETPSPA